MASTPNRTNVLEVCKISPDSASAPSELSLPLVFFDLMWYDFPATQSLLFYQLPSCSKTHFLNSIVPRLKTSLSLTLSHFLPLAGSIIHPLIPSNNYKPLLVYESGDSVSLTVCENPSASFTLLTGHHPRSSHDFYDFSPQLPPATPSALKIRCPVLALQVTLLPQQGICVGIVTHHAAADASTVVSFMKAWAFVNTTVPNPSPLHNSSCIPSYDRKTVTNLHGLDSLYWDSIVQCPSSSVEPPPVKLPVGYFRATFVLNKDEIQKLKDMVLEKCSGVARLSTFTVACSLVWVCLAKSEYSWAVADDEIEYLVFSADCRGRLNPPLPPNYFGNCVALMKAEMKHGELIKGGDNSSLSIMDGIVKAVDSMGKVIERNVFDYDNEKGIVDGAEEWREEYRKLAGKRQHGVVGSPRFDFYSVDFGWGIPNKFEALFIDSGGAFTVCKSREYEGGLEIGLSKPKPLMDAFISVFQQFRNDFLMP